MKRFDRKHPLRCTIAVGVSSLLFGCTSSSATKWSEIERHVQRAVPALARQTDADSLAAAGMISLSFHRDASLGLLARATAAAPERADLAWLQAQVCAQVSGCDPEPVERHLRELDPANGAGWMVALVRADSSKNEEATDSALVAIGHSERFDVYWTMLAAHLSRAIAQTKKVSIQEALVWVTDVLEEKAIPAYEIASKACKGYRLGQPKTIDVCRGVASAFEGGDTYITEMIGVAIAKRVWPEDSPEWKRAAEARRVYDYRSKLAFDEWDDAHAEEYLALCAGNRREQDVFRAVLVAEGKEPNPP